jgi:hypothetical protein
MAIHYICNFCKDTGYIGSYEMLHCTCTIGIKCERRDEMEVQFAINMVPVDVDTDVSEIEYENDDDEYERMMDDNFGPGEDRYIEGLDILCPNCRTSGYLSTTPIIYCDCPRGLYYNGNTQALRELIGDRNMFIRDVVNDEEYHHNMNNIESLQNLPFDENIYYTHAGDMRSIDGVDYTIWDEDTSTSIHTEEYDTASGIECNLCHMSGYISTTPIEYCTCEMGRFYQGDLDIAVFLEGVSSYGINFIMSSEKYNELVDSLDLMENLPFDENTLFVRSDIQCYSYQRDYPNC